MSLAGLLHIAVDATDLFSMETPLTVRPLPEDASPRTKPVPQVCTPLDFAYLPSDDGTDENLLILFHGLGKHLLFPIATSKTKIPVFTIDIR